MNIGERVKQLRKEKGMTQEELATKLGYKSKSSVTHIENGRDIPRSMVVQLADILETTPSFLMGWSEQKENAPIINDRSAVIERINSLSDEQFEKLHDKLEGYLDGLMEE
jgi:repressor LexA